jgi:predicted Rossmann fold flavoprotein
MNEASEKPWDLLVIGGGAAGFFGAIALGETRPGSRILILERGREVLQKVRISGGGRCNVTHACFDPRQLVTNYPRGERELLGPFMRFGPQDTVAWFKGHGVSLKTEKDGRMFPVTDQSETIASCLELAAARCGVILRCGQRVEGLRPPDGPGSYWQLRSGGQWLSARRILVASGSSAAVWQMLGGLGLAQVPAVPSLFTLNIRDPRIQGLAGVSLAHVGLGIEGRPALQTAGPMLITHWGLSGPAILRLSAWGARDLAAMQYRASLRVNWTGEEAGVWSRRFQDWREGMPRKSILQTAVPGIPARLWERLVEAAGIPKDRRWAELRREEGETLLAQCHAAAFRVEGKSTFKEEFVTAGGVDLKELDFRRFEARRFPGLHLAGEVLDIDAITGGFNFQAAWTGGWLAGQAIAVSLADAPTG